MNWQREQSSKMNRFRANPFFSVPLIGSLIWCHRTLQEGEPTVSGERGRKRETFGLDALWHCCRILLMWFFFLFFCFQFSPITFFSPILSLLFSFSLWRLAHQGSILMILQHSMTVWLMQAVLRCFILLSGYCIFSCDGIYVESYMLYLWVRTRTQLFCHSKENGLGKNIFLGEPTWLLTRILLN